MIPSPLARTATLLLAGMLAAAPLTAQAVAPDTAGYAASSASSGSDWPAAGLALAALALLPLDERITTALLDEDPQADGRLHDLADGFRLYGFPGTVLVAGSLYAAGRLQGAHGTAALGLRGLEAIAAAVGTGVVGKVLIGRARPAVDPAEPYDLELGRGVDRGDRYQSFPSTHTAAAFALAAAITAESRSCCAALTARLAPVLYGGAVLVGLSRMYDGRHWASDAVAGAAVGTLAGLRVVRYHQANPDSWLDHWLLPRAAAADGDGLLLVWVVPLP